MKKTQQEEVKEEQHILFMEENGNNSKLNRVDQESNKNPTKPQICSLLENKEQESENGNDTKDRSSSSDATHQRNNIDEGRTLKVVADDEESPSGSTEAMEDDDDECGRERLKRHRIEVAGRVWIPDKWGQEELLKDWIDCSAFDASLVPNDLMSARAALVDEGRRANSSGLRIENRC